MIYVITLSTIPVPALLSVPSIKEAPTDPAKVPEKRLDTSALLRLILSG